MARLEARAKELGERLLWIALDEPRRVEEEFRLNGAPSAPLVPGAPLDPGPTPAVWRITAAGVERFSGRHAVTAALEEAARK